MDVVIAPNLVESIKKGQSLPHVQQKAALELIRQDPVKFSYLYSTALAEATVYFMKTRVNFANEMARICKFWFKSLGHDFKHVSGASSFIEMVAVHAARKGHYGNRKYSPFLKAFIRFLQKLQNFGTMDVAFNRCNAMFKLHPPGETGVPRVIDPVNPYNNFMRYWNDDDVATLQSCAAATMAKLQDLVLDPCVTSSNVKSLFG